MKNRIDNNKGSIETNGSDGISASVRPNKEPYPWIYTPRIPELNGDSLPLEYPYIHTEK